MNKNNKLFYIIGAVILASLPLGPRGVLPPVLVGLLTLPLATALGRGPPPLERLLQRARDPLDLAAVALALRLPVLLLLLLLNLGVLEQEPTP